MKDEKEEIQCEFLKEMPEIKAKAISTEDINTCKSIEST